MIKPMVYPYFKHSEEAELGAEEMIRDIKNGNFKMDILPNSSPVFTGELEYKDFMSYSEFLKTYTGSLILSVLEE